MKTTILSTIILVSVAFASCRKPKACFILNENKASAKVNEEVKFDASCSTNAKSYTWDFGNGSNDVGVSVKTKYTTPGTYNVVLTAKLNSKTNITTQTVVVTN
jgi:PKD repeat protein